VEGLSEAEGAAADGSLDAEESGRVGEEVGSESLCGADGLSEDSSFFGVVDAVAGSADSVFAVLGAGAGSGFALVFSVGLAAGVGVASAAEEAPAALALAPPVSSTGRTTAAAAGTYAAGASAREIVKRASSSAVRRERRAERHPLSPTVPPKDIGALARRNVDQVAPSPSQPTFVGAKFSGDSMHFHPETVPRESDLLRRHLNKSLAKRHPKGLLAELAVYGIGRAGGTGRRPAIAAATHNCVQKVYNLA
jgi:hypothetical protein